MENRGRSGPPLLMHHTGLFDDGGTQRIPVNVYEATDAVVIVAPMPGVRATDVVVRLDGSTLLLRAGLRTAAPKDYLVHEWFYGLYERVVELPPGFEGDVQAALGHGQLAIRVERAPRLVDAGAPSTALVHPLEPLSGPVL